MNLKTNQMPVLTSSLVWKRAIIVLVTMVALIFIAVQPMTNTQLSLLRSRQKGSGSAQFQARRDPVVSSRAKTPRHQNADDVSARSSAERVRRMDFDDAERAVVKRYRCRMQDPWPATRASPAPLAVFSHMVLPRPENGSVERTIRMLERLGYSLRRHAPGLPRYVMLRRDSPELCPGVCQQRLHDSGWRLCTAPSLSMAPSLGTLNQDALYIAPNSRPSYSKRHPSHATQGNSDLFILLTLWNVIQFKRIVFVEPITMVTGSIATLINTSATSLSMQPTLSAVRLRDGSSVGSIDTGLMVLKTGPREFLRLHARLKAVQRVPSQPEGSFQRFLANAFRDKIHGLSCVNMDTSAMMLRETERIQTDTGGKVRTNADLVPDSAAALSDIMFQTDEIGINKDTRLPGRSRTSIHAEYTQHGQRHEQQWPDLYHQQLDQQQEHQQQQQQ
eukprot:scpid77229/ scgid28096/ 